MGRNPSGLPLGLSLHVISLYRKFQSDHLFSPPRRHLAETERLSRATVRRRPEGGIP